MTPKKNRMLKNDEKTNIDSFKIGDPVYFINNRRLSKHDVKWKQGCVRCYQKAISTHFLYQESDHGQNIQNSRKRYQKIKRRVDYPTDGYMVRTRAATCVEFSDTEDSHATPDISDGEASSIIPSSDSVTDSDQSIQEDQEREPDNSSDNHILHQDSHLTFPVQQHSPPAGLQIQQPSKLPEF